MHDLLFEDSRSNNLSKHEVDSEGMDTTRDKIEDQKPLDKIQKFKASVKRSSNRVTDVQGESTVRNIVTGHNHKDFE